MIEQTKKISLTRNIAGLRFNQSFITGDQRIKYFYGLYDYCASMTWFIETTQGNIQEE